MGRTLPFEAAWAQAAVYLARLPITVGYTWEHAATHLPQVGLALVLGVSSSADTNVVDPFYAM